MKTNHLYQLVERLGELLKVDARQAGAVEGLQPVQLEVLNYLSCCNKFSDTPMAVTEYLGQTKGTVSQTIKTLENKGLVNKVPDENDKRISHIKVTEAGHDILRINIPTKMFTNACHDLSINQQEKISEALNQLLFSLIKSNDMKSFGVCHSCRHNQKHSDGRFFCALVKQPLSHEDVQLLCKEHEWIKVD
ncbi:MarR family winged helix-turn-helix transcriptional regulator [Colwelliaceae bacterium 6441]